MNDRNGVVIDDQRETPQFAVTPEHAKIHLDYAMDKLRIYLGACEHNSQEFGIVANLVSTIYLLVMDCIIRSGEIEKYEDYLIEIHDELNYRLDPFKENII
jgi:hypothetical protein